MTSTTCSQPEKSPRVNNEIQRGAPEMRFDGANANAMRVGRSASKAMRDAAAKRTQTIRHRWCAAIARASRAEHDHTNVGEMRGTELRFDERRRTT